jgi:hypothetical protein
MHETVDADRAAARTYRRRTVHRHTVSRRLVGSLDGPSKTIIVEPIQVPAGKPLPPAVDPEPERERSAPEREREPTRSR